MTGPVRKLRKGQIFWVAPPLPSLCESGLKRKVWYWGQYYDKRYYYVDKSGWRREDAEIFMTKNEVIDYLITQLEQQKEIK